MKNWEGNKFLQLPPPHYSSLPPPTYRGHIPFFAFQSRPRMPINQRISVVNNYSDVVLCVICVGLQLPYFSASVCFKVTLCALSIDSTDSSYRLSIYDTFSSHQQGTANVFLRSSFRKMNFVIIMFVKKLSAVDSWSLCFRPLCVYTTWHTGVVNKTPQNAMRLHASDSLVFIQFQSDHAIEK